MTKRTSRVLQWLLAVALVALFLVLVDTSELRRLPQVSWPWLGGVLLASAGLVWSAAARWRNIAIVTVGGGSASLTRYLHAFLLGRVLGFLLPAEATDVGIRTLALRRSEKFSLAGAAYTVLLDRLLDLIVLLWLVVPALLHLGGWIGQSTALGIGLAGIVLTPVAVGRRHRAALRRLTRAYSRMVRLLRFLPGNLGAEIPEFERQGAEVAREGRAFFIIYVLSAVKLLMVVARFYFVARALDVPVSAATAFVCVPLAQAAALAAVTPGGLGILEAGWYGILRWAGLASQETVLLVIGWRLYTFGSLLCLVLGLRIWEAVADRRIETQTSDAGD